MGDLGWCGKSIEQSCLPDVGALLEEARREVALLGATAPAGNAVLLADGVLAADAVSCFAGVAAVEDQKVAEHGPPRLGEECHEISLDLRRTTLVIAQPQPPREPHHVRVDDHAFVDAECVSKHDVGRFPCDTSQRQQILHGCRHLAAVFVDDTTHRLDDGLGLVAVETDRGDVRLDVFGFDGGEFSWGLECIEEGRRGGVDRNIRTLG